MRRNAPELQIRSLSYRLNRPAFVGEHLLVDGAQHPAPTAV
ncbi:hypothetical protein ACWDBD_32760 [Streptomyces sp. NPDC001118]